jgi:hypothetical protein
MLRRLATILVVILAGAPLASPAPAQTPAQPPAAAPAPAQSAKCGPDHAILYKKAATLLDTAEKKLNKGYTAEAKAMAKEAKSLFAILQSECGQEQRERALTEQEAQQEAINQKLSADEMAQVERLEKSAAEKIKKAQPLEATQPEAYKKLMSEVKTESDLAQKRSVKAMIYALRNQQMIFRYLGK